MASSYFGNTLTDLQSGISASERNVGDTDRAKIAGDAAKMAAYFNMLSNKARTDADAKAREAENARGYFALNMQEAQKKAQLAQEADLAGKDWAAKAAMQVSDNDARIKAAGIQYPPNQISPAESVETLRQKAAMEETSELASNAAVQANQALAQAKIAKTEAQKKAWEMPNSFSSTDSTDAKTRREGVDKAEQMFRAQISNIHANLGNTAALVRFNPDAGRFEPAVGVNSGSALPSKMPSEMTPIGPLVPPELTPISNSPVQIPEGLGSIGMFRSQQPSIVRVTTQAQFDALPPGTRYIGENGKPYRKP